MTHNRRRTTLLLAFLCGVRVLWGGWAWWRNRQYKARWRRSSQRSWPVDTRIACRNLDKLLSWKCGPERGDSSTCWDPASWPGGESRQPAKLGGSCRAPRSRSGRFEAACASSRIRDNLHPPSGSSTRPPWIDATNARHCSMLLVPMFSELGRIDEAERLVEDRWEHLNAHGEGALEPAIKLLRMHIELTWEPPSVDRLQDLMDKAGRLAPDDDRVWLGTARTWRFRTGEFDEAQRWLDACQKSRPDDVPTWAARLNWGWQPTGSTSSSRPWCTYRPRN